MEGNLESNQSYANLKGKVVSIPLVDETLSKKGDAADAKVVGEELKNRIKKDDKPLGNYTGNGVAEARIVSTKGIGKAIMVYCSDYLSLVTPKGALVVKLFDGTFSWTGNAEVSYENGELKVATENDAFNANGTTYDYQVI